MPDELEKKESTAMMVSEDVPMGFEDFDSDESFRQVPILKICQGLSKEAKKNGVEEGHIYSTLSYDSFKELPVIICHYGKQRVLHGEGGGKNLCWSFDAVTPDCDNPVHYNCNECPENIRPPSQRVGGKGKWGDCNERVNLVFLSPDGSFPGAAAMGFERSDLNKAKKLLAGLRYANHNPWSFVYHLKSIEMNTGKGDFYSISFVKERPASQEERERAADMFAKIRREGYETNPQTDETDITSKDTEQAGDIPF